MIHRIISASLSPNTEPDDVFLALTLLLTPWRWINGPGPQRVSVWFTRAYPEYSNIPVNSGRSALLLILQSFGIRSGDEVLVQAFTCVAVPNSVSWAGARPIFVDMDTSLNMDLRDAAKKITPRTKAIVVQHTFGLPMDMKKARKFASDHKLILIEDCAHALGGTNHGQQLGSFGDASFFSFGRDKMLSSVFGGVAMIRRTHTQEVEQLQLLGRQLEKPTNFWVFQQLLHPVLFACVLPLYRVGIGKVILFIAQKLRLLSFPVYPAEKYGRQPGDFPSLYANALATMILRQLGKLSRYTKRRMETAAYYRKNIHVHNMYPEITYPSHLVPLRYPLCVSDPNGLGAYAKKKGILLGNWYHNTIDPTGTVFQMIGYVRGSCPRAEEYALHIINLPTNISPKDARRVESAVRDYLSHE